MNVCVIGHGMMGTWHSSALAQTDCVRHTLVGRRPEPTAEFATSHGFAHWTTSLAEALADRTIEIVVVANPSELHAEVALLALQHDKHVLVEIPLAMSMPAAEAIVAEAARRRLTLGVVHPLRARPDLIDLRQRVATGDERVRHIAGRLFMHRIENVGATGYRRSWTDNLLWHHMAHVVDASIWLCGAQPVVTGGILSPVDTLTGIPMDAAIMIEADRGESLVCTGSYYSRERIFDVMVVTDRDSYRLDVFRSQLTTGAGTTSIASEADNCALLTHDFIEAVSAGRDPIVTGTSVLPAMRALAVVQEQWDRRYGEQSLPGRPIADEDTLDNGGPLVRV
jgi:2-hydroxy-4-carboxymuconate semialdehyde hemiacetal dehydrogenase